MDSATSFEGASEGISICLRTVIPSLFPFFVLSSMLTGNLHGCTPKFMGPVGRVLGLPAGAESIWLAGILGGYPVGAGCVAQAYKNGHISETEAQRMLSFCCNAGPAFIFGMTVSVFASVRYPCLLFLIQIISSIVVALLLPEKSTYHVRSCSVQSVTLQQAMQSALRSMASVCGWIVLFRVTLSVFERWFLWYFPVYLQVILTGITELANGILSVHRIEEIPLRFIICSGLLSFGGVCVIMQTQAVTQGLHIRSYFYGKLYQCAISTGLAAAACCFFFGFEKIYIAICAGCCGFVFIMFLLQRKKTVAFSEYLLYTVRKKQHAR